MDKCSKQISIANAIAYAKSCIRARNGWDVESLANNIESNFIYELDEDDCYAIAVEVLEH